MPNMLKLGLVIFQKEQILECRPAAGEEAETIVFRNKQTIRAGI